MAKVVTNKKGHKAIKVSRQEMIERLSRYGTLGICDKCMNPSTEGYYVAVINMWLCPDCYKKFVDTVDHYESDEPIENKNFINFKRIMGII